jgi:hypothetical protein
VGLGGRLLILMVAVVVLELSVDYLSLVKKKICIAIRFKKKLDIRKATQFTSSIARQDVLPDKFEDKTSIYQGANYFTSNAFHSLLLSFAP